MRMRRLLISCLAFGLLGLMLSGLAYAQGETPPAPTAPQGTGFTYQGQLNHRGNPVNATCQLAFRLYNAATGDGLVGTPITTTTPITHGLFTVVLNFGATAFQGETRWLDIRVLCPGDLSFTTLERQALTNAPSALYALQSSWSGISDVPTGFADGVDNTGWDLNGNAGTNPTTAFLGTTDNTTLTLRVNNSSVFRFVPGSSSPNLIGGYGNNWVKSDVYGAVIGGGGSSGAYNRVTGNHGTVSGGSNNEAAFRSVVGGGYSNTITTTAWYGTIGGGSDNFMGGDYAVISGGYSNTVRSQSATIGGGEGNSVTGDYATISGGKEAAATLYGQWAYATGNFSTPGDGQTSQYILRRETPDNTYSYVLTLTGDGQALTIAAGRTLAFEILVVGRSATGESAGYRFQGLIENVGGTTAMVGTAPTATILGEDDPSWNASVTANNTLDSLQISVLGSATSAVRWVAIVKTVEVSW